MSFLYRFFAAVSKLGILYDLKATGTGTDATFSNAQVLDTAAEGMTSGSLTVVDTSTGTVKIVSNEFEIVGTGGWNTTGIFSPDAVTKKLGLGIFNTIGNDSTAQLLILGLSDSAAITNLTKRMYIKPQNGIIQVGFDTSGFAFNVGELSTKDATIEYLILCGGYNSSGIPFKTGDTASDFLYGYRVFARGDIFITLTLLWSDARGNDGTLYPHMQNHYAAKKVTSKNFFVPTNVLDPDIMFQPAYLATFTGDDDDSLFTSYVPEIGNRFQSGQHDLLASCNQAEDQTFTNAQVLDTPAEGVEAGSLTVVKLDAGTVKLVDNEFELDGLADFNKTGMYETTGIARGLGKAYFITIEHSANGYTFAGLNTTASLDTIPSFGIKWQNAVLDYNKADNSNRQVASLANATPYQILLLCGRYNSNGIAFKIGDTVADFLYGGNLFIKGGVFTAWTLLYTDPDNNDATLYANFQTIDLDLQTYKNILIPTNVLDPDIMFQPWFLDLFTGDNDDQLISNHLPGVLDGEINSETSFTITTPDPGLEASLWDADAAVFTSGTYAWEPFGTTSLANVGNELEVSYTSSTWPAAYDYFSDASDLSSNLTVGKIYKVGADAYTSNVDANAKIGPHDNVTSIPGVALTAIKASYSMYISAKHVSSCRMQIGVGGVAGYKSYIDNLALQEVTLAEIIAVVDMSIVEGTFAVPVTIPTVNDGMGGLTLLYADDNNFVWVYYNRGTGKVELWKRVAGTFTNLINTTAAYSAATDVKAIISDHVAGTSLKIKVYYNDALIGTEQTITDAGIVDNTSHGKLNTSSENTIGNLVYCKNSWESGGTTWTIQSNAANNDPGVGADVAPINCATSEGSEANATTGWTNSGMATFESVSEGTEPTGSYSLHLVADSDNDYAYISFSTTIGQFYKVEILYKKISVDSATLNMGQTPNSNSYGDQTFNSTSWATMTAYFIATAETTYLTIKELGSSDNFEGYFDVVSVKPIDLGEVMLTDDMAIVEGIFDIDLTVGGSRAGEFGLVGAVDDKDNPANFLYAVLVRGLSSVKLYKCVAGSFTSLISGSVSIVAGATLRAIISDHVAGTSLKVKVYYNGALIGTEQTITDAGIVDNTRHGMMSTDSANSLENFTVMKRTDPAWDAEIERAKSTWTIQSNAANNNPGVGADIVSGWDFTSGWSETNASVVDLNTFTVSANNGAIYKDYSLAAGKIYKVNFDGSTSVGNIRLFLGSGSGYNRIIEPGQIAIAPVYTGSSIYLIANTSGSTSDITTMTVQEVAIAEIIAVVDMSIVEGIFAVPVTIPDSLNGVAGLVILYADDNNFVWAYYNRGTGKVELWKRVAGTFTNLINATAAYSAGADVKAIISDHVAGTSLKIKVYYNNALIGTEQSITDAGIVDNTKHGGMDTSSAITIGTMSVMKRTDPAWDAEISSATGGVY